MVQQGSGEMAQGACTSLLVVTDKQRRGFYDPPKFKLELSRINDVRELGLLDYRYE